MNNETLAKYNSWQNKCRDIATKKWEVPTKSHWRIRRNTLSSHQIGRKMKGVHRKISDTNISPLSILKFPSILHPNYNTIIRTTPHRVSLIIPQHDQTTNTSLPPLPSAIHTPFPIQPSKHIKSKTILQNKTVIKIDYQLLGKPPQIEDLFLLLITDPQEAPPNKIGEHCKLLTAC